MMLENPLEKIPGVQIRVSGLMTKLGTKLYKDFYIVTTEDLQLCLQQKGE